MRRRLSTRGAWRLLFLGTLLALVVPARAHALNEGVWTEPVNLSNTPTTSVSPDITADASGAVHVVWGEDVDESTGNSDVIYYTRWDGTSWTQPVDVLMSPEGFGSVAGTPAIAASADGYLHLVWTGGWGDTIYYSSAWAGDAGRASAWSKPIQLNSEAEQPGDPKIAIDDQAVLHVIYYALEGEDQGIYHVRSEDGGRTWSRPNYVPDSRLGADRLLGDTRLAASPGGIVHVVWMWTTAEEVFPPKGVFYARSADGGNSWSEPAAMAEGPFRYPNVATIGERIVHVTWSGTLTQRFQFHRWSADGGLTWTDPTPIPGLGGFSGYGGLAADSEGILHFAMPTLDTNYTTWNGQSWSVVEPIVRRDPTITQQNARDAAIAVTEGNLIHVVVMNPVPIGNEQGYQFDICYVSRRVEAPYVPPDPLPTAGIVATRGPTNSMPVVTESARTPTSTPDVAVVGPETAPPGQQARADPGSTLWVGVVAVMGAMATIVLVWVGRRGVR